MEYTYGNISFACGANTKIKENGTCNNPNIRNIDEEYLKDKLPISEFAWTHCVFYRNGSCIYGGECEHRKGDING